MDGFRCTVCARQQSAYTIDEDGFPRCVDCQARPVNLAAYRRHRTPAPPVARLLAPLSSGGLLVFTPRERQRAT
jgi:hypothetical protein